MLIKEKVITGDMEEETILKNEQLGLSLYGDRTHMYIPRRCWLAWWKIVVDTYGDSVRTGMDRFAAYCFRWPSLL